LDTPLQQWLAPYRQKLADTLSTILVYNKQNLRKSLPESALGNLLADLMQQEVSRLYMPVDVALLNYGGIRASLSAGPVNRGQLMEMLPFMNYVVILELNGLQMKTLLEHWAQKGGTPVAGARVIRNTGEGIQLSVGGKALVDTAHYRLATIDYLANGGDGCDFLQEATVLLQSPMLVRELYETAFLNIHQAGDSLQATTDGRFQ
jgi:2',3'-cyclic-nucleotide 2'-phosphodiesterase (5'-nucleotidase family)